MDTPLGSVLYITLGCAKNEVDTDRMRSLLTAAGYEEAFDPQDADIAIVNTCSFLASATSESIETTLELANEVQDGVRSCPIVMCGCVPSRYGDDLPDELPEVAAFVKADEEDGIVRSSMACWVSSVRSLPIFRKSSALSRAPLLTSRFPMAATVSAASA